MKNLKQTTKSNFQSLLKKLSSYFSYDDVKRLLEKEKIQITNSTLKSYLHSFTKDKVIFDAGQGWYSSIEKQFELNKAPVKEIIKTINQKLPLLPFSCWSTGQLNFFTHHILAKFITFVYTDSDYIRSTSEILKEAGYNVYGNPNKTEIERQFSLTANTIVVRPLVSKQPDNNENYAPIEKIIVDFLIENEKLKIMDTLEAENTVKKALISGRINMSAMLSYSKRRKYNLSDKINQVQLNKKTERVD